MENKTNSLTSYLRIVMKWRKTVIRNVIIVTILALIISLLLHPKFTATATVLPPSTDPTFRFICRDSKEWSHQVRSSKTF